MIWVYKINRKTQPRQRDDYLNGDSSESEEDDDSADTIDMNSVESEEALLQQAFLARDLIQESVEKRFAQWENPPANVDNIVKACVDLFVKMGLRKFDYGVRRTSVNANTFELGQHLDLEITKQDVEECFTNESSEASIDSIAATEIFV